MKQIDGPEKLAAALDDFGSRSQAGTGPRGLQEWWGRLRGRWREALMAGAVAFGLWALTVPGAALETFDWSVPVVVENLPEPYALVSVEPHEVTVRFQGRRRDRFLARSGDLVIRVDALLVKLGRRTFSLSLDDIEAPEGLRAVSVGPAKVRLSVRGP